MAYNLGIVIDINSVGFAGIDLWHKEIKFCGAHMFDAAENPKDGVSLAAPRREKRSMRHVTSRRAQRKKAIRKLLARHDLHDRGAIDASRQKAQALTPWQLRKDALERPLDDGEFARILFHIAKKRGYQSNRKGDAPNDTEGKKALGGALLLQEAMIRDGAPTAGAYLASQPKQRNGNGTYECFVTRDLLRQEVKKIFTAQRKLGNIKATSKLMQDYAGDGDPKKRNTLLGDGVAFYQQPLQSSEHLIGLCILTGQKRAPKFSYTAELFILWSKLNNTKIRTQGGAERFLTPAEKTCVAALAHKNTGGVSYKQARKELKLAGAERFNIGYRKTKSGDDEWEKIREATEKPAGNFLKLPGYQALKDALDDGDCAWDDYARTERAALDEIARVLSFEKDMRSLAEKLTALGLDEKQVEKLSRITFFSRAVNLSLAAMNDILPFMQGGLVYSSACAAAGYHHSRPRENKGLHKVPPLDFSGNDIKNPVVARAFSRGRHVINACIDSYGMPKTIILELSRHLGKPFKERRNIEREQKKSQAAKDEARNHAAEILGTLPENLSGKDILKVRLWKEQDGFCPYSGVYIKPDLLRGPAGAKIDVIIPYSRSWNPSYMNKILCMADERAKKGERTPYEYLGQTPRWEAISVFARNLPSPKAGNLLMENFDDAKAARWQSRALNDTRYAARALKSHLEEMLELGEDGQVQARNSTLTWHLRSAWGFPDSRALLLGDRKAALEAVITACSTQSMAQQLTRWNKREKMRENPSERPVPPRPWPDFEQDIIDSLSAVFVSRKPSRTITGAAHQETIRRMRHSDGKIVQRVRLQNISLEMLENLADKKRNIKYYDLLKARLAAHDGIAEKAFAAPLYMPANNPANPGRRIEAITIVTNKKNGLTINGGIASNGDIVRTDVFCREGQFFLVPVYVHHFASKNLLPSRAITIQKSEEEWEIMDKDEFLFSLYKNDLVRIKNHKEDYMGYYTGVDRATGALSLRAHDNNPEFGKNGIRRTGVRNLLEFEKYQVNFFGAKKRIMNETREH